MRIRLEEVCFGDPQEMGPTAGIQAWDAPPSLEFEFDVERLKGSVRQTLRQVLPTLIKVEEVSRLFVERFDSSIGISEFEVAIREEHRDTRRMLVHDRFFIWSVADSDNPNPVVFQFHCVVLWIQFYGVPLEGGAWWSCHGGFLLLKCGASACGPVGIPAIGDSASWVGAVARTIRSGA